MGRRMLHQLSIIIRSATCHRRSRRMKGIPAFSRYLGIDYSGAETPISSFKGLRVYAADWKSEPFEIPPPPGPRKYWTRGGIAEWLAGALSEETTTLVGIDHGF